MTEKKSSHSGHDLLNKVREVVDLIRPAVQSDGGDVEVLSVADGVVTVKFHGACISCPSKSMTLTQGISKSLKERIPEIREVCSIN